MQEVAQRLKSLRESIGLPQAKLAALMGATQASVNRYENGQSAPPIKILRWYADFFDVSMDYIFARTEQPEGGLYEHKPKVIYARYSFDSQREKSTEGRFRECKEYAERNGIMVLSTYIDRACGVGDLHLLCGGRNRPRYRGISQRARLADQTQQAVQFRQL